MILQKSSRKNYASAGILGRELLTSGPIFFASRDAESCVPEIPESCNRQEFNGQFTDVFNKSEHTQVPLPNRSAPFFKEIHVSAEGVTKLLKGLNPSKALGPDELHPRVLKELSSELGPMFAHLFQQSVDTDYRIE